MRVSKEFKVGILVVLSFLLIFIGINFLKTFETFGKVREFWVEFDESHGLSLNDEVQLHGVQVGTVTQIDLHPEDAQRVLVKFSVEDMKLLIPKEAQLWLISSDILGTKVLDLRIPHDSVLYYPDSIYQDGDMFDPQFVNVALELDKEFEAQFLPIRDKTEELIVRVGDIIFKVSKYWDNSGAYAYDASMYDVREALDTYQEMTVNLTNLVRAERRQAGLISSDIKEMTDMLDKDSSIIAEITNNFQKISDVFSNADLTVALNDTKAAFSSLDLQFEWINKGNGSFGLFTKTDSLKNEITKIDTAIKSLVWHLQERPRDFVGFSVFGLKAWGYKPDKDQKPYLDQTLDSLEQGKKLDYE